MPAGKPTIEFPNGEWCYIDGDYEKHGQHYKMYGSCGYVSFHLYDKEMLFLINLKAERLETTAKRPYG